MTDTWRFIDAGPIEAPDAFGAMPIIAASVAQGGPPVLMTSVWARPHFQLGWFEDVDAVIDLDAAREAGVDVFRRPVWGGGTAFYDAGSAGLWSWFVREEEHATPGDALDRFRPVMEAALASLGLGAARLEGDTEIHWKGRTLGTLTTQSVLGTRVVGGLLNLRKPDLDLYRRIASVPEEKFLDKAIKVMVANIATPADVNGEEISYARLRDAITTASREVGGLTLAEEPLTVAEQMGTAGFVRSVAADDWIRRVASSRFRAGAANGNAVGFATVEARTLVRAGVEVDAGNVIVRAMLAGDMHVSPPDAMDRIASALAGACVTDRDELVERIGSVLAQDDIEQDDRGGIAAPECADAIQLAAKRAMP